MSLSAERRATADRAIRHTVERASVAWRGIPHWDTGDPGQVRVRNDVIATPAGGGQGDAPLVSTALAVQTLVTPMRLTLAQATAATPDALLAAVVARAAHLAADLDAAVLGGLMPADGATGNGGEGYLPLPGVPRGKAPPAPDGLLGVLLAGRRILEDAGYRAPACLVVGSDLFAALNQLVNGAPVLAGLLTAGNVGELHRSSVLDTGPHKAVLIGRGQEIPPGRAGDTSPGEEPVDLAVAVPPSLEVVGETAANEIGCVLRLRYALRVKDERGVVVLHD